MVQWRGVFVGIVVLAMCCSCLMLMYDVQVNSMYIVNMFPDLAMSRGSRELSRDPPLTSPYTLCEMAGVTPVLVTVGYLWATPTLCRQNRKMAFVILLCSVLVGTGVYIKCLSSFSLWCGYDQVELNESCDFAAKILTGFEEDCNRKPVGSSEKDHQAGPITWMTNGTLLSFVRNEVKTNRLLRNDHDFDVCVSSEKFECMKESLIKRRYFFQSMVFYGTIRKMRVFPESTLLAKGHSGPLMVDIEECGVPPPLKTIKGCNDYDFNIEVDAERYLESVFGKTWRIPQSYNHYFACLVLPNS